MKPIPREKPRFVFIVLMSLVFFLILFLLKRLLEQDKPMHYTGLSTLRENNECGRLNVIDLYRTRNLQRGGRLGLYVHQILGRKTFLLAG